MANDRSIITWDKTIKAKEHYQIYDMLIKNYKAFYGEDLPLDEYSIDTAWLDALAETLYDFSLLAVDVYNTTDISNAKGGLLDNLVLLSGNIVRKTPLNTIYRCQLEFGIDSDDNIAYDNTSDQIAGYDSLGKKWIITPVNSTDEYFYFDGIYPIGHESEGEAQLVYLTHNYTGDVLLPNGASSIIRITKNSLFETETNIQLNNIIIHQRGAWAETDTQLKARKRSTFSYNSTSLIDSIREKVLGTIFNIRDIRIYNSVGDGINLDLYDGTNVVNFDIPVHDLFVIIKPEEGVEIEQGDATSLALTEVLQNKITLGISTYQALGTAALYDDSNYHTNTVGVTDDQAYNTYTETFRYYVAQKHMPYVQFSYTPIPNSGFNLTTTKARVLQAVYEYAKNYTINKDINKAELMAVALEAANLDPLNPTCRIDSVDISNTATYVTDHWELDNTNDIFVNNGYWYVDIDDEEALVGNEKISCVQT